MEITEINLISDFEVGMKCLQNPSFFSRFSPIFKVPQVYSFWKWGALILAFLATFSSLIHKIKLFIYRLRLKSLFSISSAQAQTFLDDDDFDFTDDELDTSSSLAESDDDEYETTSSTEDNHRDSSDEVFRISGASYWEDKCQNGNMKLRRRNRFSWSDFSARKNVVQLWDSFELGLEFEDESSESEIAIWDLHQNVKITSGRRCEVPVVAMSSPALILSAEINDRNGVVMGAYDTRVGRKTPAIYAVWQPRQAKAVGVDGAGGYASTVVDSRKLKTSPLDNVTEGVSDTWWDADAVIVEEDL